MADLTNEAAELRQRVETLEQSASTPRHSLEFQLALENGNTVSARIRKLPMTMMVEPSGSTTGQASWPDGAIKAFHTSIPIPSDWVTDTPLILIALVHKGGAGVETAVMNSWISSTAEGETWSWNIESSSSLNPSIPASSETRTIERTITGASVSSSEVIGWFLQRVGDDGADTLNESLFIDSVWLEYTAFF